MELRKLGRQGLEVAAVGLGCAAMSGNYGASDDDEAVRTIHAAIDLGIRIDINLDDLRLNEHGLSRSHFRFCRIRYPIEGRGSEDQFGYLLYIKLSLTGNEGEFLRLGWVRDVVERHA